MFSLHLDTTANVVLVEVLAFPLLLVRWVASGGCGRCGKREAFSKSCGKVRSSFPHDVSFHSPVLCWPLRHA